MMTLLSREAILGQSETRLERVEIPEWSGHVFVRMLSAAERDKFEESNFRYGKDRRGRLTREPAPANYRARLAVLCACDSEGKRLFADSDAVDLGRKSADIIDRIATAAARLNKLHEEAIDEAEGNSESGQNGCSTTD